MMQTCRAPAAPPQQVCVPFLRCLAGTGWETWCHRVRLHVVTYAVFFCIYPEGIGSMARTWVLTCGVQILSLEENPPPPCRAGAHAAEELPCVEQGSHTSPYILRFTTRSRSARGATQ